MKKLAFKAGSAVVILCSALGVSLSSADEPSITRTSVGNNEFVLLPYLGKQSQQLARSADDHNCSCNFGTKGADVCETPAQCLKTGADVTGMGIANYTVIEPGIISEALNESG
jgi:hypothetical protein